MTERKSKPRARTPSPNPPTEYSMIMYDQVKEAVRVTGSVYLALKLLEVDKGSWYRLMVRQPQLASEIRAVQEQAKDAYWVWLRCELDEHIAAKNLLAVMFSMKREDPSYRESYNVTTTNAPTDFKIDLGTINRTLNSITASSED